MEITVTRPLKMAPKNLRINRKRRSSLRDINKRYGRTIRFPFQLKADKRLRHATDSTRSKGANASAVSTSRNRIILWGSIIAIAVILGGMSHVVRLSTIHEWGEAINGWLLILLILFLPLVGMPMSVCGIMVGAKFGAVDGMGVMAIAVAFHLSASWGIARSWLRKPMEKLLKKTRYKMPSLQAGKYAGVCLLTALIPGPSYTLKNYFLALSKLPLRIILGVGLPANLFAMPPGVLLGSFTGAMNWQKGTFLATYALLLFAAGWWVTRMIRARSKRGGKHAVAQAA